MPYTEEQIANLVEDKRIHKNVYVDQEVFEIEMERIWGSAWIFIGHESQVPKPGDYTTQLINHKIPVLMIRDRDMKVHVLHNRCGHKGARVVTKDKGNSMPLRCAYHGWTFDCDGSLKGIPNERGYDNTGFDMKDPCYGMMKVAQYESYRGFIFATLSKDAPSLETWMGGAKACFDNLCDRAPEGEVEVAGGIIKYEHDCNWKFMLENLNDTMHPMIVHQSVVAAAKNYIKTLPPEEAKRKTEAEIVLPFGGSWEDYEEFGITGFKYGHHYDGGEVSIHSDYTVYPEYWDAMVEAYGEEKTKKILSFNTHNTLYYPSLTIKTAVQNIRIVRPVSVNKCIIETWSFRLKGAPDEMLRRTLLYSRLINSAGSMVGPDDLEVYMRIQEGLKSDGAEWIEMFRQFGRDEDKGDRIVGGGTSDLDMRIQYGAWKEYMTGEAFAA
jgi:phenylpropionate dioxygenase-like ring-hydroxylating dioxygenase large terminal subunit